MVCTSEVVRDVKELSGTLVVNVWIELGRVVTVELDVLVEDTDEVELELMRGALVVSPTFDTVKMAVVEKPVVLIDEIVADTVLQSWEAKESAALGNEDKGLVLLNAVLSQVLGGPVELDQLGVVH